MRLPPLSRCQGGCGARRHAAEVEAAQQAALELRAQKALDGLTLDDHDEQVGVAIIRRSREEPIRQIANNAGVERSIVVARVRENENRTSATTRAATSTRT